jgi:hypothetical protein
MSRHAKLCVRCHRAASLRLLAPCCVFQVRARLCFHVSVVAQRFATVVYVLPRCGTSSLILLQCFVDRSLVTSVSATLFVVFVALSPAGPRHRVVGLSSRMSALAVSRLQACVLCRSHWRTRRLF